MSRATMPAQRPTRDRDLDIPLQPTNAPLVRIDSGVVCEACELHIDTNGQCRCSA